MKRIIACSLCFAIMLSVFLMPVNAAGLKPDAPPLITTFEDGSYCITTIAEIRNLPSEYSVRSTKTGTKTSRYYDSNDNLLFCVRLKGTFTYDGYTATAISAQFGYTIYDSSWSFVTGSSGCTGATASATCSFLLTAAYIKTLSVTLTCSPSGTLS